MYLRTANAETFRTSADSTIATVISSTLTGAVVEMIGITTAIWGLLANGTSVIMTVSDHMRVAVLGSAGSLPKAPFKNSDLEKWAAGRLRRPASTTPRLTATGISGAARRARGPGSRASRAFSRCIAGNPDAPWFSRSTASFLRDFKGPVLRRGAIPEIPNAVLYPIDKIEEMFSSYFLTSSLALMVALAIYEIEELRKQSGHDAAEDVIGCGRGHVRDGGVRIPAPRLPLFVLEGAAPRHRRLPAA